MSLPKLTKNLNNIQGLSDRPNTADGLTSAQLKQKFDQAGNDIKDYLNNELLSSIEKEITDNQPDLSDCVKENDYRLSDSRKCNNNFDDPLTARENLKIKIVSSTSEMTEENTIYLLRG
ncbi:MAG: hypothetical protein E7168_03905 [Firmicutes bacterium]|nr:hypothetical protein [Bacillota bacterium]